MKHYLDAVAGSFGIVAAVFWFMSARQRIPAPTTGFGGAMSPDHPFLIAMETISAVEHSRGGDERDRSTVRLSKRIPVLNARECGSLAWGR